MTLGKCLCVCVCVCTRVCACLYMCVCVCLHAKEKVMGELVHGGQGDKGAFPTEQGRKEPGGREGIETHHEIRAS